MSDPQVPNPKKRGRSIGSRNPRKSTKGLTDEEIKIRDCNRQAVERYRTKKTENKKAIQEELKNLESKNNELTNQIIELKSEITKYKDNLIQHQESNPSTSIKSEQIESLDGSLQPQIEEPPTQRSRKNPNPTQCLNFDESDSIQQEFSARGVSSNPSI